MMFAAAAKVENNCEETYKKCSVTCQGELSKCKLSGRPDEYCEKEHQNCMKKCDKAKADCQGGSKKS